MKIVVDTNVIVSGLLNPSGYPGDIVNLILSGGVEILVDDRILAEYYRVLHYSKFPFTEFQIEALLSHIRLVAHHITAAPQSLRLADPDDQAFFEVCKTGEAIALVTGNLKHFAGVKEARSAKTFMEQYGKS